MDEDLPKPKEKPAKLDAMGVGELETYIAGLVDEIDRAKQELDRKKAVRSSAASLFKS